MEYSRTRDQKIRANFAYRLGRLMQQYDALRPDLPAEEQYEAPLSVCVLQSLLTSCKEMIREMAKHKREGSPLAALLGQDNPVWGLRRSLIARNTFANQRPSVEDVLGHLRDALSHPTYPDPEREFASTGFYALGDGQLVTGYAFVHSPDMERGKPKRYPNRSRAEAARSRMQMSKEIEIRDEEGKCRCYHRDGTPAICLFEIRMSVDEVRKLALGLSAYLAQQR